MRVQTNPLEASAGVIGPASRVLMITTVLVSIFGSALAIGVTPVSAHGPGADGCTRVPDSGYGFEFHATCDGHDACYRSRPYGDGYRGRSLCDRTFRSGMLRYCERHTPYTLRGIGCRATARVYYYGVRSIGYPYWARGMASPIG